MSVDGVETEDLIGVLVGVYHHKHLGRAPFQQLAGCFLQKVVDLFDSGRKSRSIMSIRIERLNGNGF
jgi:hypothetical protein